MSFKTQVQGLKNILQSIEDNAPRTREGELSPVYLRWAITLREVIQASEEWEKTANSIVDESLKKNKW